MEGLDEHRPDSALILQQSVDIVPVPEVAEAEEEEDRADELLAHLEINVTRRQQVEQSFYFRRSDTTGISSQLFSHGESGRAPAPTLFTKRPRTPANKQSVTAVLAEVDELLEADPNTDGDGENFLHESMRQEFVYVKYVADEAVPNRRPV